MSTAAAEKVRVRWSQNFDTLLAEDLSKPFSASQVLEEATHIGRIHLQAPPGYGKTTFLFELWRLVGELGIAAQFIDAAQLGTDFLRTWDQAGTSDLLRFSTLLNHAQWTNPEPTAATRSTPEYQNAVVLIDGIDEMKADFGQEVLDAADEAVSQAPALAVVIADRKIRRQLRYDRWRLGTVESENGGPLLLESFNQAVPTRLADILGAELEKGGLTRFTLERVAKAMIDRGLEEPTEYGRIPAELAPESLPDSLVLSSVGATDSDASGAVEFGHPLFRDYAVGLILSRSHSYRTKPTFDLVTGRATHFESLALATELTDTSEDADEFAHKIYSWNFYAAGYLLRRYDGLPPQVPVTAGLELALLALIGERKWDPILKTATAATDELRLLGTELATRILSLSERRELYRLVDGTEVVYPWFTGWKQLFLTSSNECLDDTQFSLMTSDDAILAWTTSNVLKRVSVSGGQLENLRGLLRGGEDNARWRAAHSLGAFGSEENADALFVAAIEDSYRWVQRAATRSLVEMAALGGPGLRGSIAAKLRYMVEDATQSAGPKELERSLLLSGSVPSDWAEHMGPVADALRRRAGTKRQVERLLQLAYELREAASGSRPSAVR